MRRRRWKEFFWLAKYDIGYTIACFIHRLIYTDTTCFVYNDGKKNKRNIVWCLRVTLVRKCERILCNICFSFRWICEWVFLYPLLTVCIPSYLFCLMLTHIDVTQHIHITQTCQIAGPTHNYTFAQTHSTPHRYVLTVAHTYKCRTDHVQSISLKVAFVRLLRHDNNLVCL